MSNPTVLLETTSGDILIELFPDKAPDTVANFLQYVDDGFYANTIFHRVIPGFMIQGGGLGPRMDEKATRAPIKNEADNGLSNDRGTIAMARTMDPHSATAQFFINLVAAGATACSARSWKAWTWWTRSPRSRPRAWASTRTCPPTWCSSPAPAVSNRPRPVPHRFWTVSPTPVVGLPDFQEET